MITEFTVTPRPTNNKARHLFFALLITAVLVGALYVTLPQYKGVVGMVCLLFIVAAIYVYNRYMAIVYRYEVMIDSDGVPLLVVRHSVGKRESTLARVELSHIVSVKKQSATDRREHKTPEGCLRYAYLPTLAPEYTCLVTVRSRHEHAEITLEGNDEFVNLLANYADIARREYGTDTLDED